MTRPLSVLALIVSAIVWAYGANSSNPHLSGRGKLGVLISCGAAVICSSATSLPEVVGKAALLVDPLDGPGWASALAHALDDPALRDRLRREALRQAAGFTWARTAEQTLDTYAAAVGAA